MNKWRGIMVVMCACVLLGPTVSAQFLPGISEITGFGGVTINGKNKATTGIAVALNMSPQMGLEGEVGVIFTKDETLTISGNAVLNLGYGTSFVVPYLTGGAGMLNNGGTEIALNLGGGFKLFVEPNLALRTDFRVFLTTEDGDVEDLERFYAGVEILF